MISQERAYSERLEFAERQSIIPEADTFILHKVTEYNRPYGIQEAFITENRQFKVFKAEGYDFNANHRIAWLSITPLSEAAPLHDWRIMQTFKNQLCGLENYAVEIYPAESDLLDANNNFHLWVYLDGYKPPFGMRKRIVVDPEETLNVITATPQRPFSVKPSNTMTPKAAVEALVKGRFVFLPISEAHQKHCAQAAKQKRREKRKRR